MPDIKAVGYNLFEYETRLSKREVSALVSHAQATGQDASQMLAARSTYLSEVDGVTTSQSATESLHHYERGSRSARQATRFHVHGLHEYKGKFNPQLARALINAVDPAAETLLDPFCGSGTTLIEGMRLGLSVAGIDQNPLAAWMSAVKVATQALAGESGLVARFDDVADAMRVAMKDAQHGSPVQAPGDLSDVDGDYLTRWFPPQVLSALWAALEVCRDEETVVGQVAELCLSNVVREVSWQLPEDLRVRRRGPDWEPPSVAELFADSAERGRRALVELERATPIDVEAFRAEVILGSSRDRATVKDAWGHGRRLAVTSPPYATALPYIDTDRLSIVLLGLAPAGHIRGIEQDLTGSREWTTRASRNWDQARQENASLLPPVIMDLLDRIEAINKRTGAGFRRLAVPSLLYRYFSHMGETMAALSASMRPGEHVVMVVGANRTGSGDHQTTIATPDLLGHLAALRGFEYSELIPLQAWKRFAMHSKNSTHTEEAIVLTVNR